MTTDLQNLTNESLPPGWYVTKLTPPDKKSLDLVLAMYVNQLTSIPAVIASSLVCAMPDKYPCWRALVKDQDFVVFTLPEIKTRKEREKEGKL